MLQISNLILRPTREVYNPEVELGPKLFFLQNRVFRRSDVELVNQRNQKIQCSHFEPLGHKDKNLPCVVYCHGNCGSRIDSFETVENVLPKEITVFAFDFSGSGISDGDFVSLGYYEKNDIQTVVEYLINVKKVNQIALWGRSMGAVSALLYAHQNFDKIKCIILDSPFCSIQQICKDIAKNIKWVPKFLASYVYKIARQQTLERASFDMDEINPLKAAKNCILPAIFIHGTNDSLVDIKHSYSLMESYQGQKSLLEIQGSDHNSLRPEWVYNRINKFLEMHLTNKNQIIEMDTEMDDELARQQLTATKQVVSQILKSGRREPSPPPTLPDMSKTQLIDLQQSNSEQKAQKVFDTLPDYPYHWEVAATSTNEQISERSEQTDKIAEMPQFKKYNMNSYKFENIKQGNQNSSTYSISNQEKLKPEKQNQIPQFNSPHQRSANKSEISSNATTIRQPWSPVHPFAQDLQNENEIQMSARFLQEKAVQEWQKQQKNQSIHSQKSPFQMFKKADEELSFLGEDAHINKSQEQSQTFLQIPKSPLIDVKNQIMAQIHQSKKESIQQPALTTKIQKQKQSKASGLQIRTLSIPDSRFIHQYQSLKYYKKFQKFNSKRKQVLQKLTKDIQNNSDQDEDEGIVQDSFETKFKGFNATNFNMSSLKMCE